MMHKNIKKLYKILIGLLVLTLAFTACAPAAAPVEEEAVAEEAVEEVVEEEVAEEVVSNVPVTEHYKFAWIMPDMFNPFWVYMRQGAEKGARELREAGIQVDIQQMAPIQTFNVEEQVAIFENAIQMKVDGIGICVIDQTTVIEQVNSAVEAGIPVASLSTDIPNSDRTIYSGFDNTKQAEDVGKYVVDHNDGSGNYIILSGIPGNLISEQRDTGYTAAIDAYPDAKLLDLQPAYFNRADGLSTMENMMQKYGPGEIQGVLCVNDEVALGALEAIYAAGRESEIVVGSIDGNWDAANSIKEGRMLVTSSSYPWLMGYEAVLSLEEWIRTGATDENPEVLPQLIDADKADDFLATFAEFDVYYKP